MIKSRCHVLNDIFYRHFTQFLMLPWGCLLASEFKFPSFVLLPFHMDVWWQFPDMKLNDQLYTTGRQTVLFPVNGPASSSSPPRGNAGAKPCASLTSTFHWTSFCGFSQTKCRTPIQFLNQLQTFYLLQRTGDIQPENCMSVTFKTLQL